MASGLTLKIELEGFEDPLTAIVQIVGHEDLVKLLKEIKLFEDPLTARVHIESFGKAITVRTSP